MTTTSSSKRKKDVGQAGNGGQFAATGHAESPVSLPGTVSSRGITTTVTFPDGTVAERTSKKGGYTHAVMLSPEIPELVTARAQERIKNQTQEIARIDAALEKPSVRIRDRKITGAGEDPDVGYDGKPRHCSHEVYLCTKEDPTVVASSYSNSKGITGSLCTFDSETGRLDLDFNQPQSAHEHLRASALSKRATAQQHIVEAQATIAAVEAGTYDLGGYGVARWSSREDLAEKAARSEFPNTTSTRRATVVAVD